MRRPLRTATLAAALALLPLASCAGKEEAAPALPHVVLVSIDTLRADHLSCYGYPVATSPHLDRFAAGATRWERAWSTAPWTLPAHASMFTGLYPFEHGARTVDRPGPGPNAPALREEHVTLAEVLRSAGYATWALVANEAFLSRRYALDQGFERYVARSGRAAALNRRLWTWLEERDERPLFLFLNYMDTHRPYNSIERPGLLPRPVGQDSAALLDRLYAPVLSGEPLAASEEMQRVVDMYDTAIANLDEELGELFGRLRELGLWDDALVVVTSDHGEYFGEHALIEHSKDVYEEALRVPLIVKRPGQTEGRVVSEPIDLTAVPALVLGALPEPVRERLAAGLPAAPAGEAAAQRIAENYWSRRRDLEGQPWGARFHRVRQVLREGDWKYVHSSDGAHELFDLAADPREQENLLEAEPERAAAMRERLLARLAIPRRPGEPGEVVPLDEEHAAVLDDLGYGGGE